MMSNNWTTSYGAEVPAPLLSAWQTFQKNPAEQELDQVLRHFFTETREWSWASIASLPVLLSAIPTTQDKKVLIRILESIEALSEKIIHVYYYYDDMTECTTDLEDLRWDGFIGREEARRWIPLCLTYFSHHLPIIEEVILSEAGAIQESAISAYYHLMKHCKGDTAIRRIVIETKYKQELTDRQAQKDINQLELFQ